MAVGLLTAALCSTLVGLQMSDSAARDKSDIRLQTSLYTLETGSGRVILHNSSVEIISR